MQEANIIKNQLCIVGNTVYLQQGDWTSMPFKAVINHLWRKKSSAFLPSPSEIGQVDSCFYLYIGPSNHDITALGEEAVLISGNTKYRFRRRDCVSKSDEVLYYTGVLEKLEEGDEYEEY